MELMHLLLAAGIAVTLFSIVGDLFSKPQLLFSPRLFDSGDSGGLSTSHAEGTRHEPVTQGQPGTGQELLPAVC